MQEEEPDVLDPDEPPPLVTHEDAIELEPDEPVGAGRTS
jgi:hypothetical protein